MRVLIVDDHPIVISGCRALLGGGIDLLEARTAKAGLAAFEDARPDVTVIDINLPDESGLSLARRLLARAPAAAILILSMNDDAIFVREAIAIGARGFVSKNDDPRQLVVAIEMVGRGDFFLPEAMTRRLTQPRTDQQLLTPREQQIVRLLSEGSSLAEIAAALDLSYKTVTQACTDARRKLEARTPAELVRRAIEQKLI